jgi:hypothetical protein
MHAPTDFAHAAAVERILRANGVTSTQCLIGDRSHNGDSPLWGHGMAPAVGLQSLRATRPQSGGC